MQIRKAVMDDMERLMQLMEAAREIMQGNGNPTQWADGYPQREVVERDIEQNHCYVCVDNGVVVGTFVFMQGPEPAYHQIEDGAWIDDRRPYYVVHRVASTPESRGVFAAMMEFCWTHSHNIRIDTHRNNHIMRHCFQRHGFAYCGIVRVRNGEERLAYQRVD